MGRREESGASSALAVRREESLDPDVFGVGSSRSGPREEKCFNALLAVQGFCRILRGERVSRRLRWCELHTAGDVVRGATTLTTIVVVMGTARLRPQGDRSLCSECLSRLG